MAKKEIQIYNGEMLWNDTNFYSNGKKKMSTGTITMIDTNNNPAEYRYVSFRSQVYIQSDAMGKNGMKGIKCKVHGYFEENTYKGETTMQIMVDKLFLDGYEQLAADAAAAGTPLPQVPAGTLPSTPVRPMTPNGMPIAPTSGVPQPNIPSPVIPTHVLPAVSSQAVPGVIPGGYIMQNGTVVAPVPPVVKHVTKPAAAVRPPVIPNLQPQLQVEEPIDNYIPAGDLPEQVAQATYFFITQIYDLAYYNKEKMKDER